MGKSWKSRNELSHFQSIDFPQGWPDNCMGEWAIFSANGTRTAGYPHQRMKFVPVLQLLSCVRLLATPWTAAHQAILFITSQSLLKLISIELVMLSNHTILCCPLLLLASIFPSIRVFSNESALYIRGPKYWSFSFSISPSNEFLGLIFFRIDWFDLLEVQGTLKSLPKPQFKSINSLALSFLYSPTLISTHDYWKKSA